MKYTCPCCGKNTLNEQPPGTYEICPICNWEDDELQFNDPSFSGGANELCLYEAREKYRSEESTKKQDNLTFEKIWQDETLIELKISASSEYVSAYQNCYIQDADLEKIAEKICNYTDNYTKACYLEFGKKEGNYTPAFSISFLPADMAGHVKMEVDMEIDDNDTRAHRCCFYVNSELGLIDILGKSLKELVAGPVGESVSLQSW